MKGRRFENFHLMLVAMIMAILLEVYFYSPDNSVRASLSAVLEVVGIPNDMIVISPENAKKGIPIHVQIRGPRPLVEQVLGSHYRFTATYPEGRPSRFRPPIDAGQMWLPVGVEVVGFTPEDLLLELEHEVTKDLPVSVRENGKVRSGFFVSNRKIFPPTIAVQGPESLIDDLNVIQTHVIEIGGLTESREFEVELQMPLSEEVDSDEQPLKLTPSAVKIFYEIKNIPAEATFGPVNVKLVVPPGFAGTVEPSKVRVTLVGEPPALAGVNSSRIDLRADATHLHEGAHEVKLKAELPEGLYLLSTDPDHVLVKLVRKEVKG